MKARTLRADEVRALNILIADKTKTKTETQKAQAVLLLDRQCAPAAIRELTGYGRLQVTHNRFIEDIDAATDELVRYFKETRFPYALLGLSPSS
jgi:hypothetical protein